MSQRRFGGEFCILTMRLEGKKEEKREGGSFFLKKGEVGKEKGNSRAVMFSMAVLCNY